MVWYTYDLNYISIHMYVIFVRHVQVEEQFDTCGKILAEIVDTSATATGDSKSTSSSSDKDKSSYKWQLTHEQQLKFDKAQEEMHANELFRRYGLCKSLAYVSESRRDATACRDAIVKLTWFASKRAAGLAVHEWIELMKDLQYLQAHVYRGLISYQECTEIFLSSLLASRSLANIRMANDWLQDIYIVDKEGAVALVLKAAQDYFNSSSSYMDSDMDYAKECLHMAKLLIVKSHQLSSSTSASSSANATTKSPLKSNSKDSTRPVKAVLDEIVSSGEDKSLIKCVRQIEREEALISCTRCLVDLDYVHILPVQVRSCPSPLKLVAELIAKKPDTYKDYEKLLGFSRHLHASKDDDDDTVGKQHTAAGSRQQLSTIDTDDIYNQAPVILLIAEHAILKQNIPVLTHMCKHLLRLNYADGWLCAYRLAEDLCTSMIRHLKNEIVASSLPTPASDLDPG
jgi:hypothetical protein